MDLQIVQKYPESYRLDHPNFGSVLKTDFKKAKIIEVKKLQDDPMKMDALVKVEGVADYLPLFFHPKKQYWDSPEGVKAQDFDPEQKLFKRAWMSFRAGDEVAVIYQEGEPVAVIGFADGVPRVGENIFKVEVSEGTVNVDTHDTNKFGEKGPDGLGLGLLKECKPIFAETINDARWEDPPVTIHTSSDYTYFVQQTPGAYDPAPPPFLPREIDTAWIWWDCVSSETHYKVKYRVWSELYYILVPVGPLLLWVAIAFGHYSKTVVWETTTGTTSFRGTGWIGDATGCVTRTIDYFGVEVLHPECIPYLEGLIAGLPKHSEDNSPGPFPQDANRSYGELNWVWAAPYTDELYERARAAGPYDNRPKEFVIQVHPTKMGPYWANKGDPEGLSVENATKPFSIFCRPHTKEELQEAGMWPS